jgi:formyl-CoA transferase
MYAAMAVVSCCWAVKGDPAAKGRVIDVDLVSSVFSLMEGMLPEHGLFGWVRQPAGAAIPTAAPTNTYLCADGKWLCVAGNSDLIFRRLMAAIGRPELAEEPRFADNRARCAHVGELDAAIGAWTRTLPAREAEAMLEAAEVPCSRLYDIRDCAEDPHFRARGTVMEVEDPLIGRILHPAAPFRLDGVAPADMVRWTGPAAGAHNDHVFRELLGEGR